MGNERNKHYFEVNVTDEAYEKDESILLIGYRIPSADEAKAFLAETMRMYECDRIVDIIEVSRGYAEEMYDMEDESGFRIFE